MLRDFCFCESSIYGFLTNNLGFLRLFIIVQLKLQIFELLLEFDYLLIHGHKLQIASFLAWIIHKLQLIIRTSFALQLLMNVIFYRNPFFLWERFWVKGLNLIFINFFQLFVKQVVDVMQFFSGARFEHLNNNRQIEI